MSNALIQEYITLRLADGKDNPESEKAYSKLIEIFEYTGLSLRKWPQSKTANGLKAAAQAAKIRGFL